MEVTFAIATRRIWGGFCSKVDEFVPHTQHANFRIVGKALAALLEKHPECHSVPSPLLSGTMHLLISIGKSTPPQNRQLNILIDDNSEGQVDVFVGELTF